MQAIRVQQTLRKNGELTLRNLPISKGQNVEILLLYPSLSSSTSPRLTARDLLNSELIGLWKDRADIDNNLSFARQLREKAQTRENANYADLR